MYQVRKSLQKLLFGPKTVAPRYIILEVNICWQWLNVFLMLTLYSEFFYEGYIRRSIKKKASCSSETRQDGYSHQWSAPRLNWVRMSYAARNAYADQLSV